MAPEAGCGGSLSLGKMLSGWVAGSRGRGHPGDGAVEAGKRLSPDPEASLNAVLPVFHLCCMLFFFFGGGPRFLLGEEGVGVETGASPGVVGNGIPRRTTLRPPWRRR